MAGERTHRRSRQDRHNQGEGLVRIAVEKNVDIGGDGGEIRIANLIRHVCVRFGFCETG